MTQIEQRIAALTSQLENDPDDADALYERGTLQWRLDRRAQALTDLNRAAALNPSGPAPAAVANLNAILNFFNPDLYNP